MASTVESLVNQALTEIGYPGHVADIYEGSEAANAALEVYGQTRDELMDGGDWPLARRANVALTLLKGPPPPGGFNPVQPWNSTYPPSGWLYQYAYPADCLDLHAVLPSPGGFFAMPKPAVWRIDNDNSLLDRNGQAASQQKAILTNIKGALAVYLGQVTDPALWEPGFTALVIKHLSEKLALRLRLGETASRAAAAAEMTIAPEAAADRG